MPSNQRGIDPSLQKGWAHAIEKQEKLRLKWFRNNENRLNEITNQPHSKKVPEDLKLEVKETLKRNFQNVEKFPRIKTADPDPPIEPDAFASKKKSVVYSQLAEMNISIASFFFKSLINTHFL